jgi:hypothetical protein
MPYPPSAYELHQRKRWLRHDMHLWIRHDAARWVKPGTDPADVFPTLARERAQKEAARERARAAEDAAFDAWIEGERRWNAAMRAEVDELKAARARQRLEEAKYSPDQPRIPKRNPGGGQWTRIGGGGGQSQSTDIAPPMGNVDIGAGSSETDGLFNIGGTGTDSANVSNGVLKVAAADETGQRYSVDLEQEDARGGHAKSKRVGKTDSELIDVLNADYQRRQSGNLEITEFREAEGSFASLEQANELVNRVLRLESDNVDNVAEGKSRREKLEQKFDSVTGKEAFRPNGDSDPYIRDTYGVRVVIKRDGRSPRGYTVVTAFPVN